MASVDLTPGDAGWVHSTVLNKKCTVVWTPFTFLEALDFYLFSVSFSFLGPPPMGESESGQTNLTRLE